MPSNASHWDGIFSKREAEAHSWFQPSPDLSLDLLAHCCLGEDARVIDVGAGDSRLVDRLLERGNWKITALDISAAALERTKQRLGIAGNQIEWVVSNVLDYHPDDLFNAWHDRAAFHFLLEEHAVAAYVKLATQWIRPGGCLVLGTFSVHGPLQCSGLDVRRYTPNELEAIFSAGFVLQESHEEIHHTPAGQSQAFIFCRFQRRFPDV